MSNRAIILAGGKGTRLKPYTLALPKPLVPIGNTPILEIIINQLVKYEFNHITLAVNHMADIIKAYFGDGSKWNIKIDYSFENIPLNTIGPLKLIKDLPENFLLMNGDILTDLNFRDFFNWHMDNGSIYSISSYFRQQITDYGVLEVDKHSRLTGFHEKPTTLFNVSMGIYVANVKILEFIPENTAFGFDDLMLDLIKRGEFVQVKAFDGYWLDIGRPDDYEKACNEINNIL